MCTKHKFIVNIKKSYSSYVYCVSIYMMHAWIVGVAPNQNRQVFIPFSFHIYCIWNYRYYNLKIMFHISFLYGNFLWVFVISLPKMIFYFCLRINVAETKISITFKFNLSCSNLSRSKRENSFHQSISLNFWAESVVGGQVGNDRKSLLMRINQINWRKS